MKAVRPTLLLALPAFTALLAAQSLKAQTWDGGGAGGGTLTWGTATNWNPDGIPANTGAANIIMAGTIDNNPGPDLSANWDINSLIFNNTAGPFVLQSTGGFTLTVGNISNNDTQTQTISHAVSPKAGAVWDTANGALAITGAITGGNGFTKQGNAMLTLGGTGANSYAGTTTLNSGNIVLQKSAGVTAIPGTLIIGDGAGIDTLSLAAGSSNQIADSADVTVNASAQFSLGGETELIGPLTVGNSALVSVGASAGFLTSGALALNGGIIAGGGTASYRVTGSVTTDATGGSFITVPTFNLGGAVQTFTIADSAADIDLDITSVVTNGGISKTGPGTLRLNSANNFTGGITLSAGTLAFGNNAAAGTGNLNLTGGTITADGAARILGNSGQIGAGPLFATGTNNLNLSGGFSLGAPSQINVSGIGGLTLSGSVGPGGTGVGITKTGTGNLTLSGPAANPVAGNVTVTVNEGTVTLAKTGSAVAASVVVVGDGTGTDTLIIAGPGTNQITDSGAFTVAANGVVEVQSSETVSKVTSAGTINIQSGITFTLSGSSASLTGGLIQGAGTLALQTGVNTNLSTTTALISSPVDLAGGARTFIVAAGLAFPDLEISGVVSNGSLIKSGAGSLLLSNSNTFSGYISSAGFTVFNNSASAGTGTITLNGGSIEAASGPLTFTNALALGGIAEISGAHDLVFTGSVTVAADSELRVGDTSEPATLTLSGAIGDGGTPRKLTKSGLRTLRFNGASANTYTGLTEIKAGTLELGKSAPNGTIPGNLSIGDGSGAALNDKVRLLASDQIADTSAVTLHGIGYSAQLDLNNFSDTIGSLTLNGGYVVTGTGVLKVTGGVQSLASSAVSEMSGRFDLNGGTIFNVEDGAATTDLSLFGPLSSGPLIKNGAGRMFLGGVAVSPVDYTLNSGAMEGNITVQPGFTFTQNGGDYSGTLYNSGSFIYNGGTFNAILSNSGTVTLNAPFTVGAGLANDGEITVTAAASLTANGSGLTNNGSITLQGGSIAGSGPLENNSLLTGYGSISGSGGFTNNALILQSGGNLTFTNSGANTNNGNIDLQSGRQLILPALRTLQNAGTVNLNGGIVSGAGTLANNAGGSVTGRGSITALFANNGGSIANTAGTLNIGNAFTNTGTLALDGLSAALNGGAITNNGTIQGRGSIGSSISNSQTIEASGGTLTLSGSVTNTGLLAAPTGAKLLVTGSFPSNAGTVSLTGGTFDTSGQALSNTSQITGYGTVRTGGLTNNGSLTLTGGLSTVNGSVTNASGRTVHVAHNPAIFTGAFVNNGIFKNTETTVTFTGTYTENGTYVSDPADNYFTDLLIGTNGKLNGGIGDRFFVLRDFTNGSTQSASWATHDSDLIFEGGPAHTFALAGADAGANAAGFTANFAWKTVRLAAGQSLTLNDGNATPGAALYTLAFILDGGLAQIANITGNGHTIYYDPADALSAPLNSQTYPLTGGGFLKPIAGAALTITASAILPGGALKIDVLGQPNALHTIEASTDLVTFTPIGTVTANGAGIFSFIDTDAAITRRRYYKITLP